MLFRSLRPFFSAFLCFSFLFFLFVFSFSFSFLLFLFLFLFLLLLSPRCHSFIFWLSSSSVCVLFFVASLYVLCPLWGLLTSVSLSVSYLFSAHSVVRPYDIMLVPSHALVIHPVISPAELLISSRRFINSSVDFSQGCFLFPSLFPRFVLFSLF